ncbi:MAG: TonB-dependent receptor plug domain-containing protein [Taibaiella sp.]|nr:TonB-dependent receptor plug domain-containing protein [Taibaiella sp.]
MLKRKTTLCFVFTCSGLIAAAQEATDSLKIVSGVRTTYYKEKKLLELSTVTNFTNMLSIGTTGIQATSSGAPGTDAGIAIRGYSNRHFEQNPLIILDGLPYLGSLSAINPAGIESITLHKSGISADAPLNLAADGIIELVSKQASAYSAPWQVSLDVSLGVNTRAIPEYDLITDPRQFYELRHQSLRELYYRTNGDWNEAGRLAGNALIDAYVRNIFDVPDYTLVDPVSGKFNAAANLRYQDKPDELIQRTGLRQAYNLQAYKRFKSAGLSFNAGYLKENSYLRNNDFNRLNLTANAFWNASEKLSLGMNAYLTHSGGQFWDADFLDQRSNRDPFNFMRTTTPVSPVYERDNEGNIIQDPNTGSGVLTPWGKGLAWFLQNKRASDNNMIRLNPYVKYQLSKQLGFSFQGAYTADALKRTEINNSRIIVGGATPPLAPGVIMSKGHSEQINVNPKIHFDSESGRHRWTGLLQYMYEASSQRSRAYYESEVAIPFPQMPWEHTQYNIWNQLHTVDGKVVYNYNNRFDVTARINYAQNRYRNLDQFSINGKPTLNNKLNYAFKAAWNSRKEQWGLWAEFAQTSNYLRPGAERVLELVYNYFYRSAAPDEVFFFENRYMPRQTNLDLGAYLNVGRVFTKATVFERQVNNSLHLNEFFTPGWPTDRMLDGFDVRNRGVELSLEYYPLQNSKIRWQTGLYLTHVKATIKDMKAARDTVLTDIGVFQIKGGELNGLFAPDMTGVDPNDGSSIFASAGGSTKDYNTVLLEDYIRMGSTAPFLYGSWVNNIYAGKFSFRMAWTYALGGKVFDQAYQAAMDTDNWALSANYHQDVTQAWSRANTSAQVPAMGSYFSNAYSDRFFVSGSWLNLKSLMLNYSIPINWMGKSGYESLNIYAAGENLLFFSARKGLNPNADFMGGRLGNAYLPMRTVMLGVKIDF